MKQTTHHATTRTASLSRGGRSVGAARAVQDLLDQAGLQLNGPEEADPQVYDDRFYKRVLAQGSIGLGDSYMDGWWDCKALDVFFYRILRARINEEAARPLSTLWYSLAARLWNLQRKARAFDVAEKHYDLGNTLFERMLDRRMVYSCAYWRDATTLDEAQEAKLDLICRKLNLKEGMRLLDIGCGWGSLVQYAAETYGVQAVGVTVSREQATWARAHTRRLPVEIHLKDYRELEGRYDRVVSVGMFEHVGYKNYRAFMSVAHRCLKKNGLFLLHSIGDDVSSTRTDPWIHKHIFPNGMVPSTQQITAAADDLFRLEDWHNFGPYYDLTLMSWHKNVVRAWRELKSTYDDRFYRMWTYYLQCSAGGFRARYNQLYQTVWSRMQDGRTYESVR